MEPKLGAAIKRLRNEKQVTQEELAAYLGVSFQAVSKWETDTTMPDVALLPKLALFFGVKIDDLFAVGLDDELERIDSMLANKRLTDENFRYAQRILESLLHRNADDVDAIKRYANLLLKRMNRDALEAGALLEHAIALAPLDTELFSLYRQARGADRDIFDSGNDWFLRVCAPYAEKYPANYRLGEMLVDALLEARDFDTAAAYIARMKENGGYPDALADILAGDATLARGSLAEAMKMWDAVHPADGREWYELGERYNRVQVYEKAITCYRNAFDAETAPRDLSAVYALAFLYTKQKRYQEAIASWQCIIDVLASDYRLTAGETVDWPKREIVKLKSML